MAWQNLSLIGLQLPVVVLLLVAPLSNKKKGTPSIVIPLIDPLESHIASVMSFGLDCQKAEFLLCSGSARTK